jgi:hypothetical protein
MTEAEDWKEYFRKMDEARAQAKRDAEEADDVLEIIEPSRPARLDDLNASIRGIIASLAVGGYWSASQVTRVLLVGKEFKTGQKAGDRRPDKELTNVFIYAARKDGRQLSIWYQDGKLVSARVRVALVPWSMVHKVSDLEAFIEGGDA